MMSAPIDPTMFVATVQPLLEQRDLNGLCGMLRKQWRPGQLVALLKCPCNDTRKVAALSLGLVGSRSCIPGLVTLLRDPDRVVNEMAEHALWSIWFRCGTASANRSLIRGASALGKRNFDKAVDHFTKAIEYDPTFAEAFNQRSIAWSLQERHDLTVMDCRETVQRMSSHFHAWSNMGHAFAHLGEYSEAIASYEQALRINPHLDGVRAALREIRHRA